MIELEKRMKNRHKREIVEVVLIVALLLGVFVFIRPQITGMVVGETNQTTLEINEVFNESSEFDLSLQGNLTSLSISGSYSGEKVEIYLDDILVYGSDSRENNLITGNVIGSENTTVPINESKLNSTIENAPDANLSESNETYATEVNLSDLPANISVNQTVNDSEISESTTESYRPIVELSDECVDTCVLDNYPSNATLRIVVVNATLNLSSITYTYLQDEEISAPDENLTIQSNISNNVRNISYEEFNHTEIKIGEPVTWSKTVEDVDTVTIPGSAYNIQAESAKIEIGDRKLSVEEYSRLKAGKPKEIKLELNTTKEVEITYQTPGPEKIERKIDDYRKQVTISSVLHYKDVLAHTEIDDVEKSSIQVHWLTNSGRKKVDDVSYFDENNNGLIDKIEWVVPHLSNQTYEISITILNPYTYLRDGETWTVAFNTTGIANLTITSPNAGWTEFLTDNEDTFDEMEFLELKCGENSLKDELMLVGFDNLTYDYTDLSEEDSVDFEKLLVRNYECTEIGYLSNYMHKAGYATLLFEFENQNGSVRDWAYDPVGTYNFVDVNRSTNDYYAYHKSGSANFTGPDDTGNGEATDGNYSNIASSDGNYWVTANASADGEFDAQLYKFYITESESQVTELNFTWEGYGENESGYNTTFYAWDYDGSQWVQLDTFDFTSSSTQNLTHSETSDPGKFINDTDGEVTLMAKTEKYYCEPVCGDSLNCTCDGTGYETRNCCNGDTVYVDCNADKCWSPTADSYYDWSTDSLNPCNDDCTCECPDCSGYQACYYCATLDHGGKTDWHLPDKTTLENLCNSGSCSGTCFGGDGELFLYWSSTEYDSNYAWYVYFDGCDTGDYSKNMDFSVRCVRSGSSPYLYTYQDIEYKFLSDFVGGATSKQQEYLDFTDITYTEIEDDKVKLKITEELNETAYIDRIYLRVDESEIVELASITDANISLLRESDDNYLVMVMGAEHYLEFPAPDNYTKLEFAAEGYYIEHYKKGKTSNRGSEPHNSLYTDYVELKVTENTAPNITTPTFSPATAYTDNDINCNATPTDGENDTLTVEWFWYNGTELMFSGNKSGVSNGTNTVITTLGSGNTSEGEIWNCTVRTFDGHSYSDFKSNVVPIRTPGTYNFLGVYTFTDDYYTYQKSGSANFTGPDDTVDGEATDGNYSNIASSDGNYWVTANASVDGEYDSQLFKFYITESESQVTELNFTWEGYGENESGYNTTFYAWDYDGSQWVQLDTFDFNSSSDQNLTHSESTNPGNYIDTDGEVTLMAKTEKYVDPCADTTIDNCSCSGSSYCTLDVGGDTVYVDCNADKCWSPTAGSTHNWSTDNLNPCNDDCTCECPDCSGYQACNYCDTLDHGGKTDWHLPDKTTLENLCNSGSCSGTCFGGDGASNSYWSSTEDDSDAAWFVYFWDCFTNVQYKYMDFYVRCVRSGSSPYVYTYHYGEYKFLSDFVGGATSKQKEYLDFKDITHTEIEDGKVKLKITEELNETAYIDKIYLRVDGNEIIELSSITDANISLLRESDDNYLVMEMGAEHYLEFPAPDNYTKLEFAAEGYYVEHYRKGKSSRSGSEPHNSLYTDYVELKVTENTAPDITSPTFSPTTAYTDNDISCNATPTDAENDTLTVEYFWYNGTELMFSGNKSGVSNGTNTVITTLGSGNTSEGEIWNCTVRTFDGHSYSDFKSNVVPIRTPGTYNFLGVYTFTDDYYTYQKSGSANFTGPDDTGDGEATDGNYSNIASSDGNYWVTANASVDGEYDSQLFKFYITEPEVNVSKLEFSWEGYGENKSGYNTTFYAWDYDGSQWVQLDTYDFTSSTDQNLTHSETIDPGKFINDTDGKVVLMAKTERGFHCGNTVSYTNDDGSDTYDTVEIGDQCWLAENLNIDPSDADNSNCSGTKYCYSENSINCDTYGGLYKWAVAMCGASSSSSSPSGVQGLCPDGWHFPSDAELATLEDNVCGDSGDEGSALAGNAMLWTNGSLESDNDFGCSGFDLLPGGIGPDNFYSYWSINERAYLWSSTEDDSSSAFLQRVLYYDAGVIRFYDYKTTGRSVRCIKDSNSPYLYIYQDKEYNKISDFVGGATSKDKEYLDFKDITRTEIENGKVKLKITEELNETAYIDNIYLRVDLSEIIELSSITDANISLLRESDDNYLVMEMGAEHYLEFPAPDNYTKLEFAAEGYYVEHYKKYKTSNRGSQPHNSLYTDYVELKVGSNSAPNITTPTFSPATAYTDNDISCNATPNDGENDTLAVEWFWYNGTELMLSGNKSGVSNGTNTVISILGSGNTTKGEIWNCTIRSFDGSDYSDWDSAEITIQNNAPTLELLTPTNANTSIRDRTPEFTWNGNDDDGDTLNYTIWVANNSELTNPIIDGIETQDENYTCTVALDVDTQYFWRVQVSDGESYTNSSTWNFTTESYIEVQFINESISFGSMNLSETKNTTSDNPYPFVLQNMGNVLVNVTFGVTGALWDSALAPLDTSFLQFKADERTEAGSFDYAQSQTTWMNLSTENKTLVQDLNYSDANDEVVVDILIRVPEDEPAGSKSTNFVIEIP